MHEQRFNFRDFRKDGFTLLELLVACTVIIICLSGIVATYVVCLETNETTKNRNLAINAAQQILEEMRSTAFTSVFSTYNGSTFQVQGMSANSSQGYVSVDNADPDLLEINVGVCWRQKHSRIIGECQDTGGVIVFSDANGNGLLDSPVMLTMNMAQR